MLIIYHINCFGWANFLKKDVENKHIEWIELELDLKFCFSLPNIHIIHTHMKHLRCVAFEFNCDYQTNVIQFPWPYTQYKKSYIVQSEKFKLTA